MFGEKVYEVQTFQFGKWEFGYALNDLGNAIVYANDLFDRTAYACRVRDEFLGVTLYEVFAES